MNRLSRDQIIIRALDMSDSPSLNSKCRPNGTIVDDCMAVGWLQDALDLFHNTFPWAGILTDTPISINTDGVATLPANFILDVRDGVIINKARLGRRSFQRTLDFRVTGQVGDPVIYTVTPPGLRVHPRPRTSTSATLVYYALPNVMEAGSIPSFPSDWVLVEFVRLRAREWLQALAPGSAMEYARKEISALRQTGLANEPEDDRIPLDRESFVRSGGGRDSWMGSTVPQ